MLTIGRIAGGAPKVAHSPGGSGPPPNTWFLSLYPRRHLDRFSRFSTDPGYVQQTDTRRLDSSSSSSNNGDDSIPSNIAPRYRTILVTIGHIFDMRCGFETFWD